MHCFDLEATYDWLYKASGHLRRIMGLHLGPTTSEVNETPELQV